jgi:glycosyltransferase involved in cell wall biosynthesis
LRIHRIKGIDILVKAFADVIEKLDDVRLVVAGPDNGYLGKLPTRTRFAGEAKTMRTYTK